jgi:hypothetical protein
VTELYTLTQKCGEVQLHKFTYFTVLCELFRKIKAAAGFSETSVVSSNNIQRYSPLRLYTLLKIEEKIRSCF